MTPTFLPATGLLATKAITDATTGAFSSSANKMNAISPT